MKRKEVEKIAMTFETMVNANVTTKFGTAIRQVSYVGGDDYHFYVGAPSIICSIDWDIIKAFAFLNHVCWRYKSRVAEWEMW